MFNQKKFEKLYTEWYELKDFLAESRRLEYFNLEDERKRFLEEGKIAP